jgi:hypothetical protein
MFVVALAASPALADGLFDTVGKATGLIAPPADPPDFVRNSRPSEEPTSIPVFAPPPEPTSKVKTPAELKAMDSDLERASDSHKRRVSAADDADAPKAEKRPGKKKRNPGAQP